MCLIAFGFGVLFRFVVWVAYDWFVGLRCLHVLLLFSACFYFMFELCVVDSVLLDYV